MQLVFHQTKKKTYLAISTCSAATFSRNSRSSPCTACIINLPQQADGVSSSEEEPPERSLFSGRSADMRLREERDLQQQN
jgi:hypothetical protein